MLAVKGRGVLLVKLGEGDNLAALIAERLINKMQVGYCIFTIFVEYNKMFGKIRKENISAFSKSQKYPRFQISSHQTAPTVYLNIQCQRYLINDMKSLPCQLLVLSTVDF